MKNILPRIIILLVLLACTADLAAQCPCTPDPNNPGAGVTCDPDHPQGSPVFCDLAVLDGFCDTMPPPGMLIDPPTPLCPDGGGAHNMTWFSFVASNNNVQIVVTPCNCDTVGPVGMGLTGVQAGIYEDCDYANSPFCQSACSPAGVPIIVNANNFVIGEIYHFFLDGCGGSVCDYVVEVVAGGGVIAIDDQQVINGVEPGDGPVEVCLGYQDFLITTNQSNVGDGEYEWVLPNGDIVQTGTNPEITYTFDEEGTFDVCVTPFYTCDTAEQICVEFEVAMLPPIMQDTFVCEGEIYIFEPYGIPVDQAGENAFQVTELTGCIRDVTVNLDIIDENDQNPTAIVEVLCSDEVPYQLADGVLVSECGFYNAQVLTQQGCDSFLTYDITVIDGTIEEFQELECIDGVYSYSVVATQENQGLCADATFSFQWKDPDGNEIPGQTSETLNVIVEPPGGTYTLCTSIELNGTTCTLEDFEVEIDPEDFLPEDPTSIEGPDSVCLGAAEEYSTDELDLTTFYLWETPPGAVVISGYGEDEVLIDFTVAMSGDLCVTGTNPCGESETVCMYITVIETPEVDAGPDQEVCGFDTLTMDASDFGNGEWAVFTGPGNVFFSDDNSATTDVWVDAYGSYQLVWWDAIAGCSAVDSVTLEFLEEPQLGMLEVSCQGASQYTVTFTVNGGEQPYEIVLGDGSFNGNEFTSDAILSDEPYEFQITDANNCGPLVVLGDTVFCDCLNAPGMMDPTTIEVCVDELVQGVILDMGSPDYDDIGIWFLHDGPGLTLGTIFDQNGTGEFGFDDMNMTPGETYYISWVLGTEDSLNIGEIDLDDDCLAVAQGQPVIWYDYPTTDAGPDDLVCGLEYELDASTDLGSASWIDYSGPGIAVFEDINSGSSMVTVDMSGVYEFVWAADNNGCTDTTTVTIEFAELPMAINLFTTCNENADLYVVNFEIEGGVGPYTIITGDGELMGDAFESDTIMKDTVYSFVIEDANGCQSIIITGVESCICESLVGTMDNELIEICADELGSGVYDSLGQFFDGDDVVNYVLHDNDTDSLGMIFDQNDTGEFGFDEMNMNYGEIYYISAIVGDGMGGVVNLLDGCLAVSEGQPIVWYEYPTANAGGNMQVCGFTFNMNAEFSIGALGQWVFLDGPGNADVQSPTDPNTLVNTDIEYGIYSFVWTETNAICSSSDTVTVTVLDYPEIVNVAFDCNDSNTGYVITFDIVNGDASSYMVTSIVTGNLIGNSYTSDEIVSGDMASFEVSDMFDCEVSVLDTSFTCPCESNAGIMAGNLLEVCEDELAIGTYIGGGEIQDGNDVLVFVLHTGSGDELGTVLDINGVPEFGYDPGDMMYGVTYYISSVVGDDIGGEVDTTMGACYDVYAGQPVIFYEIPVIDLNQSLAELNCENTTMELDVFGTTPPGSEIEWTASNGGIIDTDVNAEEITISAAGTYTVEVRNGACVRTESVDIDFSGDLPSAEAGTADDLTCSVLTVILDASGSDVGPDFIYIWLDSNGDTVSTEIMAEVSEPGVYTLRVINIVTGCPASDQVTVVLDVETPEVIFDAVGSLDCQTEETTINAGSSSTGAEFTSEWSTMNGEIVTENGLEITVGSAGMYTLTITNEENGCMTSETVEVTEIGNTFADFAVEGMNIACFGDGNGRVEITSLTGGAEPVQYSFDGGATFQNSRILDNASAGEYVVIVRDANGCTLTETIVVTEPPLGFLDLPADTLLELGESLEILSNTNLANTPGIMVEWSTQDTTYTCLNLSCTDIQVSPIITTSYTLTIIDSSGCVVTDNILVRVKVSRNVYVPSVFTPNFDGQNDFLGIYGQETVEIVQDFSVYDRWGQRLFQAQNFPPNDPTQYGWNGEFKGEPSLSGVYVYHARVLFKDGFVKDVFGDVTLLR